MRANQWVQQRGWEQTKATESEGSTDTKEKAGYGMPFLK